MVGVFGYMPQNFSKASEYASLVLFGFEEGTLSIPSKAIVGSSEPTLTEDTLVSEVRVFCSLVLFCVAVASFGASGSFTLVRLPIWYLSKLQMVICVDCCVATASIIASFFRRPK